MRIHKKNEFTVVIPVKDRHDLLERAILSVRYQKGVKVNLVIVDDGSKSPVSKPSLGGAISEVSVIRNEFSRNAAVARNQGAKKCTTEWIAFLDSDDEWANDHLSIALIELNKYPAVSFYLSSYRDYKYKIGNEVIIIDDPYKFQFETRGSFRTSCFVIKSENFNHESGFYEGLNKHQDWDLGIRLGKGNPFLWNMKKTVIIDSIAENRMSYNPHLESSRLFFERHREGMTRKQASVFLSGLVIGAARTPNDKESKNIRFFVSQCSSPFELSFKAIIASRFPFIYMYMKKYIENIRYKIR